MGNSESTECCVNINKKNYLQIGNLRLMDIEVIYEDTEKLYTGKAEDASSDIKRLLYSRLEIGSPTKVYVYNQ